MGTGGMENTADTTHAALSPVAIEAYRRDGAVCLRGCFSEWVEDLRRGVAHNMAEPGSVATEHRLDDGRGRFFEDYCNWQRIPEYRRGRTSRVSACTTTLRNRRSSRRWHTRKDRTSMSRPVSNSTCRTRAGMPPSSCQAASSRQ